MRVIPLIIAEEKLQKAEKAAGDAPLLALHPFVRKTACIVSTGSEVKLGRIKDTFTPVVIEKLRAFGIENLETVYSGDGVENIRDAVLAMRAKKPDMILCTGGMSVDPDDNTPGGIKAAGADIVCYGAPVLPRAMFLLGYFADGMPVMGLSGCVMYAGATAFDLVLPKVAADVPVTRADIAVLGEGDYTAHVDRVIRDLNGSVVLLRPADSADAPFLRVRVPEEAAIAQGSTVTFGLRPDKCLCYA